MTEEPEQKEDQKTEKKKFEMKILKNIKLSKLDVAAIAALLIFLMIVSIPVYTSKGDCEIARPEYKCASSTAVMQENCNYWGKYDCDSSKDVSLPQIEWYIGNLCKIANKNHNSGLSCENLKAACNQVTKETVCPTGV